jgi:hypothetical protein
MQTAWQVSKGSRSPVGHGKIKNRRPLSFVFFQGPVSNWQDKSKSLPGAIYFDGLIGDFHKIY